MGIDADDGQGGLCRRSAVRGGNLATEHMTPLWVHRARMYIYCVCREGPFYA
jgi:hypothetical protein